MLRSVYLARQRSLATQAFRLLTKDDLQLLGHLLTY